MRYIIKILLFLVFCVWTSSASAQKFDQIYLNNEVEFERAVQASDIKKIENVRDKVIGLKKLYKKSEQISKIDKLVQRCNSEIKAIRTRQEQEKRKLEAARIEQEKKEAERKRQEEEALKKKLAEEERQRTAKLEYAVGDVKFSMIRVEAGSFLMGATEEQPQDYEDELPVHKVIFENDYYIGETEVTQALWEAVMGDNPSDNPNLSHPVEYIDWEECCAFTNKLSQLTGQSFRLPTEEEWEYAARGGHKAQSVKYSGGNSLSAVGWYEVNSQGSTQPVKLKKPNVLGIYDMSGNVSEWCGSAYKPYSADSIVARGELTSGLSYVIRGGNVEFAEIGCRVSARGSMSPTKIHHCLGLRLVMDAPRK